MFTLPKPTRCLRVAAAFCFLIIGTSDVIAVGSECSLDEAYDSEDGFNGLWLSKVTALQQSKEGEGWFSEDKQQAFLASSTLVNLCSVDFSGLGINDDFIGKFCNSEVFSRVNSICLNDNPDITVESLEYLRDSRYIGSLKESRQTSGRYGCPGSTVTVDVANTGVSRDDLDDFFDHRFDFSISYYRLSDGRLMAPAICNGVKVVDVCYYPAWLPSSGRSRDRYKGVGSVGAVC